MQIFNLRRLNCVYTKREATQNEVWQPSGVVGYVAYPK